MGREYSLRAAREIGARESRAAVRSRPVHTNAISRVPWGNASGPGLTPRLLSRCEPWRPGRSVPTREPDPTLGRLERASPTDSTLHLRQDVGDPFLLCVVLRHREG